MAFNRENLTVIGNSAKSGQVPTLYFYHNADTDTVTASGYFNDARLNVLDVIMSLAANATVLTFYRVDSVSDNAGTVLALTTVTP